MGAAPTWVSDFKRRLAAALLAVVMAIGIATLAPPPAEALRIAYKYYGNWFYSLTSCKNRGQWLLKSQPDWLSFRCYRDAGDSKWSMDAYIDDGTGCIVDPKTMTRLSGESGSTSSGMFIKEASLQCG